MHKNFADWYRVVSIDPQQIHLDLRWKGVEAFVNDVNYESAFNVVRLFFNKRTKDLDFEAKLRDIFKEIDNSFAMRGNDLELKVLAGASIAHLFDIHKSRISDTVALAVTCADFQGLRERPEIGEIVDLAYEYIYERSDKLRVQLTIPSVKASKIDLTDIKKHLNSATSDNISQTFSALEPVLELIVGSSSKLAKSINESLNSLTKQIRLLQEESDILWWLFGEYSRDLRKNMKSVGHPAAALLVGKELADITVEFPGPIAAEAFIDRMLSTVAKNRKNKDITIRGAILAPKLQEWKKQSILYENLSLVDDICTLHFALQQSIEASGDAEWFPIFEKRSGIKADMSISPAILALQIFRECLLIRALHDENESR